MAKSLRSKSRRRFRAIKRERYAEKELARLKKTLGIDDNASKEVEMADLNNIVTVVDAEKVKGDIKAKQATGEEETREEGKMEVEETRVYNKKTLRDQYGNYPVWLSRKKMIKHKKGRAKTKKKSVKTEKRLTRRQKKTLKQKH